MKSCIFYCVLSSSFFALAAFAQNTLVIEPDTFLDTKRDQGLISVPYWLRGLHFEAIASKSRPVLLIIAPKIWANRKICANATTINGRYLVVGQYQLPNVVGEGMTELAFPTDFPKTWSQSNVVNSGIVVSEGACETPIASGAGSRLVPAVFNGQSELKRDAENRTLLVMNIHARNTQELRVTVQFTDMPQTVNCSKIVTRDAIQFNFTCNIAVPANASGETQLTVTRLNKGRMAPTLSAKIILPDTK